MKLGKAMLGLVGAAGIGALLLTGKKAKPATIPGQQWQLVVKLIPPFPPDETGEKDDLLRNSLSAAYAAAGRGKVRDYRMSDGRDLITLVVEYPSAPSFRIGETVKVNTNTYPPQTIQLLSAVKL